MADPIIPVPQHGRSGIDVEIAAWDWLESKFGTESDDPVDRAYDASEMVDAFHAGYAASRATPPTAPSSNGRTPPFEGEDAGSTPAGASDPDTIGSHIGNGGDFDPDGKEGKL